MRHQAHTSGRPCAVWLGRIALCWLLALFVAPGLAAGIKATPDRNPVRLGESVVIVFSAQESPDDEPDFRPLQQDFEIVSQSQSSQVSIVNGDFSRKTEWTLTLMPRRAGDLVIPSIAFGRDRSEPASVMVRDAQAPSVSGNPSGEGRDVLLEVEAEPRNPYVQAQVIYTVRVLLRADLAGADLGEPAPPDALVQRLGEDRRYSAERDGHQYTVVERKYALFPQKSGLLRIEPIRLEARIADGGRSRFNSLFNRATRVVRVSSDAVDLAVRPVPAAYAGKHWLPAENLRLDEDWSHEPSRLKAGEPLTRTLRLRANGATVGVLPELDSLPTETGDLKRYPDQANLNEEKGTGGVTGVRQEKTALIPGKPGRYVLPSVEVPWWNTRTDRADVARLPERILVVEPGPAQSGGESVKPVPESQPPVMEPAMPTLSSPSTASLPMPSLWSNTWFWLALLCAGGWAITAWTWWIARRPVHKPDEPRVQRSETERSARKKLQAACSANDPHAARQALLDWGRAQRPELSVVTLAVWSERGDAHAVAIEQLERSLYGRSDSPWSGESLWKLVAAESLAEKDREKVPSTPVLPPLYG